MANGSTGGTPGTAVDRTADLTQLSTLVDVWQLDPMPSHEGYVRRYAELAVALELPFYGDDAGENLGPVGWAAWASGEEPAHPSRIATEALGV